MIQTNNADLGKAFPGGMEDMVPGKAYFLSFILPMSPLHEFELLQFGPTFSRDWASYIGVVCLVVNGPSFHLCWNSRYVDRRLA